MAGASSPNSLQTITKNRGLLIAGGILSLIAGVIAIAFPLLSSVFIVEFIGALAVVSGVISLIIAFSGKDKAHRLMHVLSGIIRIIAGVALFWFVLPGLLAIALLVAVLLLVEGAFLIGGAIQMRRHAGWLALLLNGIISLLLGILLWAGWPSTAFWVLGLMFGIHLIFNGAAWLALGFSAQRALSAVANA